MESKCFKCSAAATQDKESMHLSSMYLFNSKPYFLATGYPSHKFFHSIMGVSVIGFSCFVFSVLLNQKKLPSFLGCIIGAYSHHAIDYFWYDWGLYGIY